MCLFQLLKCDTFQVSPLSLGKMKCEGESSCFDEQGHTRRTLNLDTVKDTSLPEGLTCHHSQGHLVFVIIEPARYVHTAAVRPWVALFHLPDGQRHIALAQVTHEQVALCQPVDHCRPIWLDHLIGTAAVGDGSAAPAHRKLAVVLGIVGAQQSCFCSHCGYDALRGNTTWRRTTYQW